MDLRERVLRIFNSDIVENTANMGVLAGTTVYLGSFVYGQHNNQTDNWYLMLAGLGTLLGSAAIVGASRYAGRRLSEIDREKIRAAEPQPVYKPRSEKEEARYRRAMIRDGWREEFPGVWVSPMPALKRSRCPN